MTRCPGSSAADQDGIKIDGINGRSIRAAAIFLTRQIREAGAPNLKGMIRNRLCVPFLRAASLLQCTLTGVQPAKSVVWKQHTATTFHGNAVKLKKAADAGLFCFTLATARSKLGRVQEIGCSYRSALGVVRIELISQNVDGDSGHEENRFVGNGAGNGVWFGLRC